MTKSLYPFSDDSPEDDTYWAGLAMERRRAVTGDKVVKKLMMYLDQGVEILEMECKRYKDEKDGQRLTASIERKAWIEAMIIWVNHNL